MRKLTLACIVAAVSSAAFGEWRPAPSPLMTPWGEKVTPENAWCEYPRPQLVRQNWTNLNGLWKYAVTPKAVETRGFPKKWDGEILVPFAIESALSGVGRLLDPDELLWYRRTISVAKRPGERTILHFEGVDFRTQVFVNGTEVGDLPHEGGLVPFSYDITDFAKDGDNDLMVVAWDPTTASWLGGVGKQILDAAGINYTRTSGIWQPVWMETVPDSHVTGYRTEDVDLGKGTVSLVVEGTESVKDRKAGVSGMAVVLDGTREVASAKFVFGEKVTLRLPTPVKAWSPETPSLYKLRLTYGKDAVEGYFAMRTIEKRRDANGVWRFFLNGRPYYIMSTLDQGWWPDGLLTPPSDDAMRFDIQALKDYGFNAMRKHITVEPARYYWLCDTMGLMVLQDMPCGRNKPDGVERYYHYRLEFRDMVDALRVFPSIVMWIPYNEGWSQPGGFYTACSTEWIDRYDPTRLVDGPSGWVDYGCEAADVIDMHKYLGPDMHPLHPNRISFLGEFGGHWWKVPGHLWTPDDKVKDDPALVRRDFERVGRDYLKTMTHLKDLTEFGLAGSVYTQTTDVEGEMNGLITYDRKFCKFDKAALKKAHDEVIAAAYEAATVKSNRTLYMHRKDEWQYTFERPADGWTELSFADGAWKRGRGGFGDGFSIPWKTSDLWARRHFTVESTEGIESVELSLFHDDDAEIYINGVKMLEVPHFNAAYETFAIDRDKFLAAVKKGDNVIAVHVHQDLGGQSFDAVLATRRRR